MLGVRVGEASNPGPNKAAGGDDELELEPTSPAPDDDEPPPLLNDFMYLIM